MAAVGHIHAASLASPRLRRVLDLLKDGQPGPRGRSSGRLA